MVSDKLKKILAISKNMDKKATSTNKVPSQPIRRAISLQEQISKGNREIAAIDAMFNAPYIPTQQEIETWNTERGREELTEMSDKKVFNEKLNKSKLPKAIIESMRQNPCNLDVDAINGVMGPENALYKKLNEAYGKGKEEVRGVKAVQQINEQLSIKDKQPSVESTQLNEIIDTKKQNDDINQLEQIIERILDHKLGLLNENTSKATTSTIKTMMITENGNFRFLDSEDNVYECQMKYIGKRKKKKQ